MYVSDVPLILCRLLPLHSLGEPDQHPQVFSYLLSKVSMKLKRIYIINTVWFLS